LKEGDEMAIKVSAAELGKKTAPASEVILLRSE
jgi:hypothetical protein